MEFTIASYSGSKGLLAASVVLDTFPSTSIFMAYTHFHRTAYRGTRFSRPELAVVVGKKVSAWLPAFLILGCRGRLLAKPLIDGIPVESPMPADFLAGHGTFLGELVKCGLGDFEVLGQVIDREDGGLTRGWHTNSIALGTI